MVQSTNILNIVSGERNGQLKGSGNPKRMVTMLYSLKTMPLRIRNFSGLRAPNALDMMLRQTAQSLQSKVSGVTPVTLQKKCRFEPRTTFSHFTEKAKNVVLLAQEEARRLGHNFVGTEQILLGLIGEGTGIAAKVLKSMGINLKDTRLEVEKIIGRGSGFVDVEIPFTPRAKHVLELLLEEEARQLGHNYIGT